MRVKFRSTLRFWDPSDISVDWDSMGIKPPVPTYEDLPTYVDIEMHDVKRANPTKDGLGTNLWMNSGEKILINHTYGDYCDAFGILDFETVEKQLHDPNTNPNIQGPADVSAVG